MPDHELARASTTSGLPVAPSMGPGLAAVQVPREGSVVDRRVVFISALAVGIAFAAGWIAKGLTLLIALITQLSFFGRVSFSAVSPAGHSLGLWVIVVPVAGAVVVGFMARYGSKAIRGHGIPEAMEQVLLHQSRIPPRMTFLKPLSAAVSIGTGGPFGAEGPIIATGGALGSLVGQFVQVTAQERKTLLAAGAAAGMAATFGSPVSAVILAIELLLFEYRARSIIPVALAAATATGVRLVLEGSEPAFPITDLANPGSAALAYYIGVGALVGLASTAVTKAVYWIEDQFERLPIHWMWWPAVGGLVVGVVGYFAPRTLGVGYDNITDIASGRMLGASLAFLVGMKFISWSVSLGSGTSGGTLAPLFTLGAGLGALLGMAGASLLPGAEIDPRIAALVGMAAMFAGASRALLASVVFAFETTRQPFGLLPLLGGCAAAYLISNLLMRHSIMTEKLARRGMRVLSEYAVDWLAQLSVRDYASRDLVTLRADDPLERVRSWLASEARDTSHQGFPVLDSSGTLLGVVTRRDLLDPARPGAMSVREVIRRSPIVIFEDSSLREAADHMVETGVGRLVVVERDQPTRPTGIVTRSDLLRAHRPRLELGEVEPTPTTPTSAHPPPPPVDPHPTSRVAQRP